MSPPGSVPASSSVPAALRASLAQDELLAANISANYNIDASLPSQVWLVIRSFSSHLSFPFNLQKRLIGSIMHRTEIDKKELTLRETRVKNLLAQKDSLNSHFSWSFWGNSAEYEQKLRQELLAARNSLEQMKQQMIDTSARLLKEIAVLQSMDNKNVELAAWRKELSALLDKTFEDDKSDIALRLRIMSSKSNFASVRYQPSSKKRLIKYKPIQALDQLDRHKAAEGELKVAKKLFTAAIAFLKLLEEKDSEIPDCPSPPANPNPNPTVTQTLVHTLLHRSTLKLERIAATNAYIQAAKSTTADAMARAKDGVFAAQDALNVQRILVMETVLEIIKIEESAASGEPLTEWRRPGGALVASWMLAADGVSEIELRNRPAPGPMRVVNEVPTAADVLPEYCE
ncbi:hypothetical protein HDU83_009608 [Entophlyctis luteolus]|nr:hypothetical protein HDU83_009608 [Entophlyctis luteolus]